MQTEAWHSTPLGQLLFCCYIIVASWEIPTLVHSVTLKILFCLIKLFFGWLYIYNCWWNPRILAAQLPVCAGGFVWKWGEHTSKWLFEIDHWPENLEVPYRQNSPYFFVKSAPRKPPVRMARWASPAPNPTATQPQRAICGSIPRAEEVDEQSDAQKISCSVQLSFRFYTDYRVSRTHCNILQCIAILPAQLYCLGFNLKTAIYVGPQFFSTCGRRLTWGNPSLPYPKTGRDWRYSMPTATWISAQKKWMGCELPMPWGKGHCKITVFGK